MKIPSYKEAFENHKTPLDIFVSRWEPVDSISWRDAFREDLAALIAHILENGHIKEDEVLGTLGNIPFSKLFDSPVKSEQVYTVLADQGHKMKVVKTENETVIYPLLSETDEPTDDDFKIIVGNSCSIIGDRLVSEEDFPEIIKGLEEAIQITTMEYSALCQDCGHSVEIKQVSGCLDHPVLGLVEKKKE